MNYFAYVMLFVGEMLL